MGGWRRSYDTPFAPVSAVECMNSVLRMHQERHRTVTQPMPGSQAAILELPTLPKWQASRSFPL